MYLHAAHPSIVVPNRQVPKVITVTDCIHIETPAAPGPGHLNDWVSTKLPVRERNGDALINGMWATRPLKVLPKPLLRYCFEQLDDNGREVERAPDPDARAFLLLSSCSAVDSLGLIQVEYTHEPTPLQIPQGSQRKDIFHSHDELPSYPSAVILIGSKRPKNRRLRASSNR